MSKSLYDKYPHIIPGSIERVAPGTRILCGKFCKKDDVLISRGVICVIRCATDGAIVICRKTRIVNVQDVGQVKQCKACSRYLHNMKRRWRRIEAQESKR